MEIGSKHSEDTGGPHSLVDKYKDDEMSITVTGHSLGSVLVTLNAADLVANGYYKPTASGCLVMTIVFVSPHVGDSALRTVFEDQNLLRVLRITNKNNSVLDVPPVLC